MSVKRLARCCRGKRRARTLCDSLERACPGTYPREEQMSSLERYRGLQGRSPRNGSLDKANGGTNSADQMNYAARVRKGMSFWRDKRAAKNVWESGTR